MSDAPTNPRDPHPRPNREYEDPQYHDEELEVQQDEHRREGQPPGKKKPPRMLPPPRRWYDD